MAKKIVVGLGLLGLCVLIGFTIPFVMSNQNPGHDIDIEDLKKQFEQELKDMQEQKLREDYEALWDEYMKEHPEELEDLLDEMEQFNTSEPLTDTTVVTDDEALNVSDDPSSVTDDEVDFFEIELIPLSDGEVVTEKVVKDQWVNQKIQTHKDQISDSDLSAGAGIYNRLDTNYLFGLAEGGLTAEEEEAVKTYLRANLSEAELDTAIELYNKYVHLLN